MAADGIPRIFRLEYQLSSVASPTMMSLRQTNPNNLFTNLTLGFLKKPKIM